MKNTIWKSIIVATALFASSTVLAGGWTVYQTVYRIYPYDGTANVLIQLNGGTSSHGSESCNSNSFMVLERANEGFDEIFALTVAAKYANGTIAYYLNGCAGSHPAIRRAIIK